MSIAERTLPHSLDAERSVLGAILVDNEALLHAQDGLAGGPERFFREAHRRIFAGMLSLAQRQQPIDLVTLKVQLEAELDDCGGAAYLASLLDGVPRATNVEYYAAIVREKWLLRQAIYASNQILSMAYAADEPAGQVVDRAEQLMLDLSRQHTTGDGHVLAPEWMSATFKTIERYAEQKKTVTGLSTGFRDLNHLTRGLQRSDFIVIGGRPSMGKTALALQLTLHLAGQGGLIFHSLEMDKEQIGLRAAAVKAGVNVYALLTGHLSQADYGKVALALDEIASSGFIIDDTPNISLSLLRSRARRLVAMRGDVVGLAVDYLQLMDTTGYKSENRQVEVARLSKELKALGRELKIPIIALAQLKRAREDRAEKRPQMSDLRESGALEQDADVIMLLHRPEYYEKVPKNPGLAELIIAKQRNGPIGTVQLKFIKEQTRFEKWSEEQ